MRNATSIFQAKSNEELEKAYCRNSLKNKGKSGLDQIANELIILGKQRKIKREEAFDIEEA